MHLPCYVCRALFFSPMCMYTWKEITDVQTRRRSGTRHPIAMGVAIGVPARAQGDKGDGLTGHMGKKGRGHTHGAWKILSFRVAYNNSSLQNNNKKVILIPSGWMRFRSVFSSIPVFLKCSGCSNVASETSISISHLITTLTNGSNALTLF